MRNPDMRAFGRRSVLSLLLSVCILAGCASPGTLKAELVDGASGHAFPEPLLTFAAKEAGVDAVDLSKAVTLTVDVNHCEYGEPTQTITDPEIIAAAQEAVSAIEVTGGSDGMSSTETYYVFCFKDASDQNLAHFSFQKEMLMQPDGRYPVDGLTTLLNVEGVMLEDEWNAYWEAEDALKADYESAYQPELPESAFKLSGYPANLLETLDPINIAAIEIRVSWNDEAGTLETEDPAVIQSIYKALKEIRAEKAVGEDEPVGQKWSVQLFFQPPENAGDPANKSARLSFEGDYLISDLFGTSTAYTVTGLDGLFNAADADVLSYLRESRTQPKPD